LAYYAAEKGKRRKGADLRAVEKRVTIRASREGRAASLFERGGGRRHRFSPRRRTMWKASAMGKECGFQGEKSFEGKEKGAVGRWEGFISGWGGKKRKKKSLQPFSTGGKRRARVTGRKIRVDGVIDKRKKRGKSSVPL